MEHQNFLDDTCSKYTRLYRGVHFIVKLNTTCEKNKNKNLLFTKNITKMGKKLINFLPWVDIHGVYYIVKNSNQI